MVSQALEAPGVETVIASTMAVNIQSRRVLEKVGMRLVNTYVGEWDEPIVGWEQGEVVYELAKHERGTADAGSANSSKQKPVRDAALRYVESIRWLAPTRPRPPSLPVVAHPSEP
jgi:hypothetical protein